VITIREVRHTEANKCQTALIHRRYIWLLLWMLYAHYKRTTKIRHRRRTALKPLLLLLLLLSWPFLASSTRFTVVHDPRLVCKVHNIIYVLLYKLYYFGRICWWSLYCGVPIYYIYYNIQSDSPSVFTVFNNIELLKIEFLNIYLNAI